MLLPCYDFWDFLLDWIQLDTSTVRVSEVWMDMGARFKIWHVSEHHAPHLGNYVQYVAANCEGFRSWIDHDSKSLCYESRYLNHEWVKKRTHLKNKINWQYTIDILYFTKERKRRRSDFIDDCLKFEREREREREKETSIELQKRQKEERKWTTTTTTP